MLHYVLSCDWSCRLYSENILEPCSVSRFLHTWRKKRKFVAFDLRRLKSEKMSMGSDTSWVGKKPLRRLGGMADALSIASDLGFSIPPPPSQVLASRSYNTNSTHFLSFKDVSYKWAWFVSATGFCRWEASPFFIPLQYMEWVFFSWPSCKILRGKVGFFPLFWRLGWENGPFPPNFTFIFLNII